MPIIAAIGGMAAAITLITIAAVVEKNRTTNQASKMRPMHVPMRMKYRWRRSSLPMS